MASDPSAAVLEPITSADLNAVAEFLHRHMNQKVAVAKWRRVLSTQWLTDAPNHGFILRSPSDGIVGVLCANYAELEVNGNLERFCNPHTWCVLDAYRKRSIELVIAVIKQPGFHFSMLSPNVEGEQIFQYLKFKPADRRTRLLPCAVRSLRMGSGSVGFSPSQIESRLAATPAVLRVYQDHRQFDGLRFAALRDGDRFALVIYRFGQVKRLKLAEILYLSDVTVFTAALSRFLSALQCRQGVFVLRIEQRLIGSYRVPFSLAGPLSHAKFLHSPSLDADLVPNIYSELVALHI